MMNRTIAVLTAALVFSASANAALRINEVDSDTAGTDTLEFVELFDDGVGNTSLDGYTLVFFNGNVANEASYLALDLTGKATDANGYFLAGNVGVTPAPGVTFLDNVLQNGADAVGLYFSSIVNFPNGTAATSLNLISSLVYDTNDADDTGLLAVFPGPQINEGENLNSAGDSVQWDGVSGWIVKTPTPGAANAVPEPSSLALLLLGGLGMGFIRRK